MKKLVFVAVAALALGGVAFSQDVTVSFANKISSNVVSISEGAVKFTGIKDRVAVGVESEKVNSELALVTKFGLDDDNNFKLTEYEFDTAYVEFMPIQYLAIEFNNKVFTSGSYLPVYDDNIGNGNISSDFALIAKPIKNLSIAAGIKLPSVFADAADKVDLNAGVNFTHEYFSLGATLRSPINNLGFGVYGSCTAVKDLCINLGFSYNDEFEDIKGNLLNFGASYEIAMLSFGLDFLTNFGNTGKDLYGALSVEAAIGDSFSVDASSSVIMDFENMSSTETVVDLGAAYKIGHHKIRASVELDITDHVGVCFPLSYKYSF